MAKIKEVNLFNNFRRNCQVLMASHEVTPKQLSEKFGWFHGRLGNIAIKNGHHKPTATELFIIADYFKVSVDDLIHKKAIITF